MTPTPDVRDLIGPDAHGVAVNRLRFLTSEPTESPRVRPPILASWRRSRALNVIPDRIELPYLRDPDPDTPLVRSAEPVLRRLHEQLAGQAISILLTDATGLVLSRRTGDAGLDRHLDRVHLAPGFSYAEQFVGTNGIGTALEAGSATQVYGHEHYAEDLETLACAGVPIHDPLSGRTVGLIDLTCWRKDAEALLLALAKNTADRIEQALLTNSGMHELAVLQAYRQTCRRTSGIVFAVTNDAVVMNDHARAELQPADQAALLAHSVEIGAALPAGRRRSVDLVLPTGSVARMYCHQVDSDTEPAGVVVHVRLGQRAHPQPARHSTAPSRMLLPGLVGAAPSWQRACREVEAAVTAGTWIAIEGEAGVGKSALLRAAQRRLVPARRSTVLDANDARNDGVWLAAVRTALSEDAAVVLTHVQALDGQGTRGLAAALQEARRVAAPERPLVAMTALSGTGRHIDQLLSFFPTTIAVPPLRLRLDDIPMLVPFFLAKVGSGGQHPVCTAGAMQLLMRHSWPGNVRQLQDLLHEVVHHRRGGSIEANDLPPEVHSISRRVLSTLESMERDAIVRSLLDTNGNKVQAARSLGMSRATIYRKIHEFGIITPA
jgi:transcriptional regulator of acetoin/glycerol metabolism